LPVGSAGNHDPGTVARPTERVDLAQQRKVWRWEQ
jgi:hypothetical protein